MKRYKLVISFHNINIINKLFRIRELSLCSKTILHNIIFILLMFVGVDCGQVVDAQGPPGTTPG